jgi:hypothetical protein
MQSLPLLTTYVHALPKDCMELYLHIPIRLHGVIVKDGEFTVFLNRIVRIATGLTTEGSEYESR